MNIQTSLENIKSAITKRNIQGVVDVCINDWQFITAQCIAVKFESKSARGFSEILHNLEKLNFHEGIIIISEGVDFNSFNLSADMRVIEGHLNFNLTRTD